MVSAGEKFTLEKNEITSKEGQMHLGAGLAMPAQMASQNYLIITLQIYMGLKCLLEIKKMPRPNECAGAD
jgi:hypothetical protein